LDGIEYKEGKPDQFLYSEGSVRMDKDGQFKYYFVLRDHLGNTRVTFSDLNNDDQINEKEEIIQINNYDAFGLNMEGNWNGKDGANKYQYNGKEWNDDFGLGWNDYGARMYDPAMARWQTVDPLGEKYVAWSPYNYTMNNPIRFIDPDGRSVDNTIVTNEDGSKQFTIVDNKPDAVAIFSNEEFEKRFGFAGYRSQYNTDVNELRSSAKYLYMVDGMRQLERFGNTLQPKDEWFTDKNGKRIKGLHPEAAAGFAINGNQLTVDIITATPGSVLNCNLVHNPSIHVHTSAYVPEAEFQHTSNGMRRIGGIGDGPFSNPSGDDWANARENRKYKDYYNVEINSNYIHLFKAASPPYNPYYPQNIKGEPNPDYHIIIDRRLFGL
jgi:RHS repeat-associated protein